MRICGVELKNNEAVIAVLSHNQGLFDIHNTRVPKIAFTDQESEEGLKEFQFAFEKLMADYQIEKVVILARPLKGKFAGPGATFKMEAALQLSEKLDVALIKPSDIKEKMKRNPLPIAFKATGLKPMQEQAFNTVYAYLN
ncbi:DUF3010 family protein [Catenovulum sp. SM1970]|uniref:DUF3010 family protein n=1 Tax=Marinifaba aquimaris TaxID=2741323 RepID=UPI001574C228|nr:DUF3010 family protein [Marinifaba aquimaris]NTS78878.1 DUF3010 family protein [Marinifaba aquimaris]